MISVSLNQLADILSGEVFGFNVTFDAIAIDTRKITPGCLFIALKGNRIDAHTFAEQAKTMGASALLVNRRMDIDLPQLVVKNTRLSLGVLAGWIRQQVPTRIVALTGSSGKTSVKEMTASILSQCGNTLYTEGNLNNDIGVSLTLLRLTKQHKYAVIELSASHRGEIAWASSITCPETALVNNFTAAHLESFGSIEEVAKAKGEIYTGLISNGIAIFNGDNNDWPNWQTIIGTRKIWSFSLCKNDSNFTANNINISSLSSNFILHTPIGSVEISLPLPGYHNIANTLAAAALAVSVGAPLIAIQIGIKNIMAIPGRMFPIWLTKNQLLLDDSYNSNISSMIAAIQVLSNMPGYRILVVGDMTELGDKSELYHIQVGKKIKASNINLVLSIGIWSAKLSKISGIGEHFTSKAVLLTRLQMLRSKYHVMTILVKGSRNTAMEDITRALQELKYDNLIG